jgi:2-polyprenyl-6-methoxyphenol hydroxylase-like FAD-dependent oxidoreductase
MKTDAAYLPHRAGVTGLTTALVLSKNPEYSITVVAKHMPGDYDLEYVSDVYDEALSFRPKCESLLNEKFPGNRLRRGLARITSREFLFRCQLISPP